MIEIGKDKDKKIKKYKMILRIGILRQDSLPGRMEQTGGSGAYLT